jgi:hypothetical protein
MIGMMLLKGLIILFSTAMAGLSMLVAAIVVRGVRAALIPRRSR